MTNNAKSIIKIASVYTGTVLGAGFASGQEIVSFFTRYGYKSIYGIMLSGVLFTLIGCTILDKVYCNKIKDYDEYMIPLMGKKLTRFLEILVSFFMFSSFCIMLAGSGAIFYEQLNLSPKIGIWVMSILCVIVFVYDIKGIITVNFVLAPIMFIGILLIGFYILVFRDISVINILPIIKKSVNNWFVSSLAYVSYNTITTMVIMTTLLPIITNRKAAILGGIVGGAALGFIALVLWIVLLMFHSDIVSYEIPLLQIVMKKNKAIELIYVFILYCAMFTTAVASGYGFLNRIKKCIKINNKIGGIILGIVCVPLAQFGFSKLIRVIYPLFGYLGMAIIVLVLFDGIRRLDNYIKHKKRIILRKPKV